ncbi:hypothetical protein JCM3766R1_006069 [Sporobolomyces carnicolor]
MDALVTRFMAQRDAIPLDDRLELSAALHTITPGDWKAAREFGHPAEDAAWAHVINRLLARAVEHPKNVEIGLAKLVKTADKQSSPEAFHAAEKQAEEICNLCEKVLAVGDWCKHWNKAVRELKWPEEMMYESSSDESSASHSLSHVARSFVPSPRWDLA